MKRRNFIIKTLKGSLITSLPLGLSSFNLKNKVTHIDATLFVEKKSQKGIVIGQGGKHLKLIGTAARLELEEILKTKVMLRLWVKVKSGWTDNEAMMSTMGYDLG